MTLEIPFFFAAVVVFFAFLLRSFPMFSSRENYHRNERLWGIPLTSLTALYHKVSVCTSHGASSLRFDAYSGKKKYSDSGHGRYIDV